MSGFRKWLHDAANARQHRKLRAQEPEWVWLCGMPYHTREHLLDAEPADGIPARVVLAWHDHLGRRVSVFYGSSELARQQFGAFFGPTLETQPSGDHETNLLAR